jgi:anti-sigma B factor antagonist
MPAGKDASPKVAESISSNTPAELAIDDVARDGEHLLVLRGELDLNSAPLLNATVRPICAAPTTRVIVLDLSRLTFMDSTGIHALLLTKQLCDEEGFEFFLIPGEAQAHRVLQITGLLDRLPIRGPHGGEDRNSTAKERT